MYVPKITDKDIATVKHALRDHVGETNRISDVELTIAVYGMHTQTLERNLRAIREHINKDLSDDMLIATDTKEGGFWVVDDPASIAGHYVSEHSRGVSILAKTSAIEAKAKRKFGKQAWAMAIQEVSKTDKQETLFDEDK